MFKNTQNDWGSLAKSLHWTIAFLIILEVPAGLLMSYTFGPPFRSPRGVALHNLASQIHHTNGLVILFLVVIRLIWRLRNTVPHEREAFRYQRRISFISHFSLYALLILLPLSGWASLSAYGDGPIWFFGADIVPHILPKAAPHSAYGYGFFAGIHAWCYWLGAGLLTVHIAAALFHQFIVRDNTFRRMWPLSRADATQ